MPAAANPPLHDRIHSGRLDGGADDPGARSAGRPHRTRWVKLGVPVTNHELYPRLGVRQVREHVPGLLHDPRLDRMLRGAQDPDAPGGVLDQGKNVDLGAVEEVGGEEVQRQDPLRLRSQELGPPWTVAARCRVDPGVLEDDAAAEPALHGHHAREKARRPRGLTPRARRGGTHGGRLAAATRRWRTASRPADSSGIRRVTLTVSPKRCSHVSLGYPRTSTDPAAHGLLWTHSPQFAPGSLAAAVPAIVGGVSAESAKASATDLVVTDLEVATVTDTSVITALVHRPGDRGGHLRTPAPRRGRDRTADGPRRPDGTDRRARGTQGCPGVTRPVPEPDHQPRTVTMTAAPKCSTIPPGGGGRGIRFGHRGCGRRGPVSGGQAGETRPLAGPAAAEQGSRVDQRARASGHGQITQVGRDQHTTGT